jgi:sRNA-binding protein
MTPPAEHTTQTRLERDFSIAAQRTLGRLRDLFPRTFGVVRPLKLGITEDIVARTSLSTDQVCEFLRFYCNSPAYLRASLRPGAVRYDLDGQRVAAVSTAERMHSTLRLEELWGDRQARKRERAFRAALLEPVTIDGER